MKYISKNLSKALWALLLFLLGLDFVSFSNRAASFSRQSENISKFDAVVVLTGGQNRISRAVEIAQDQDLPLFISGVFEEATPEEVATAANVDPAFFECCSTLGYKAKTTHENGEEVRDWAIQNQHNSLIVVTSDYHMERALLELKSAMPKIKLIGQAIQSPHINTAAWWENLRSTRRMILEWGKWRIVKIRSLFNF